MKRLIILIGLIFFILQGLAMAQAKWRMRVGYHDGTSAGIMYLACGKGCFDASGNYYLDKLTGGLDLSSKCFENGKTGGRTSVDYGVIEADNTDDYFSTFMNYGFDGRDTVIEVSDDDWVTPKVVWSGTCRKILVNSKTATFTLSDKRWAMDVPLQSTLYTAAETNNTDIQGRRKPVGYGGAKNISPVLIDSTELTYQVHDGSVEEIIVYDGGVSLADQNLVKNGDFVLEDKFWFDPTGTSWSFDNLKASSSSPSNYVRTYDIAVTSTCNYAISFSIDTLTQTNPLTDYLRLLISAFNNSTQQWQTLSYIFLNYSTGIVNETITIPSNSTNIRLVFLCAAGVTYCEISNVNLSAIVYDYQTRAELESVVVPHGYYYTCLNEGMFCLGSPAFFQVTADIKGAINLSDQLVYNGDFADGEDSWTFGLGWSVVSGTAVNSDTASSIYQDIGTTSGVQIVSGATYRVLADISSNAGASVWPVVGGTVGGAIASNGGFSWDLVATNATGLYFHTDGAAEVHIDNVKMWRIRPDGTAATSVPEIITLLLLSKAKLLDSDLDSTAFATVQSQNSSMIALAYGVDDSPTILDALDPVADSIGCFYGYTLDQGKFTIGRLDLPTSDADVALNADAHAFSMDSANFYDDNEGIPSYRTELNYQKVWTVQDADKTVGQTTANIGDLAGYVSEARRAFLAREYRSVSAEDTTVKTQFLTSKALQFDTLLEENAQTEANRRLAIYKEPINRFQCEFPLELLYSSTSGFLTSLGGTVALIGETLGLSLTTPKYYFVLGFGYRMDGNGVSKVSLDLVGYA